LHRVALLVLVGCGAGDTTIDRTFDPCTLAIDAAGANDLQRAGIAEALALWDLTPGDGAPLAMTFEDAAAAFHGVYEDEDGIVRINVQITQPRALSIVIAHELGHAFGLPHIDGRASLMNRGNLTIAPTADDFAAISALWGPCDARPRS
jgi:Matrixin